LSLDPAFVPATIDLVDLYRSLNRDQAGERVLDDAIAQAPNDASLRYALGLLLVREQHSGRALDSLTMAARLDPGNARYAYVYAIALHDRGQISPAITILETSLQLHPYDHDSLAALVGLLSESGDSAGELIYAKRLLELEPDNLELLQLVQHLPTAAGHPHDQSSAGAKR
jgi:tetratricopeptide (TPR) repeat protein